MKHEFILKVSIDELLTKNTTREEALNWIMFCLKNVSINAEDISFLRD
jgi:hypothetical protein